MKKSVFMLGVCGVLAVVAGASGETLIRRDTFNDNIRNTAYWRVASGNDARLTEMSRRLYYDDNGGALLGYHRACWLWKAPYYLYPGDTLETSVLITAPKKTPLSSTSQIILGIGWRNGYPGWTKQFMAAVHDVGGTRTISVSSQGTGIVGGANDYALPQNVSRFYLVIRYNTVTGKVTVWQRALDLSWTAKVGMVNLNSRWGVPLGSRLILAPFIYAGSGEISVTQTDNFYFDNFSVVVTIP